MGPVGIPNMIQHKEQMEDEQNGISFVNEEIKGEVSVGIVDLPTQNHFYFWTSYEGLLCTNPTYWRSWLNNIIEPRKRADRIWKASQIWERCLCTIGSEWGMDAKT